MEEAKEKTKPERKWDWIAYVGAALGILAFLPQIIHLARTKSAEDISMAFILLSILSSVFFFTYAAMFKIEPHAVAGVLSLIVLFVLLYYKIKYNGNGK